MRTKEFNDKNQFYESPSARAIDIEGAAIICTSAGTEGYGMNGQSLSDDDFE